MKKLLVFLLIPFLNTKVIAQCNENQFEIFLKEKNSFSLDEIKKKLKIELFWNELIHLKYHRSLNIDEEYIAKKVESLRNKKTNDYLLSEI